MSKRYSRKTSKLSSEQFSAWSSRRVKLAPQRNLLFRKFTSSLLLPLSSQFLQKNSSSLLEPLSRQRPWNTKPVDVARSRMKIPFTCRRRTLLSSRRDTANPSGCCTIIRAAINQEHSRHTYPLPRTRDVCTNVTMDLVLVQDR